MGCLDEQLCGIYYIYTYICIYSLNMNVILIIGMPLTDIYDGIIPS